MATGKKQNDTAVDIEEQVKTIREDVARLTKLLVQLGEEKVAGARKAAETEAESLAGRARHAADEAASQARARVESIEAYITEKPVQSAFIAFMIGMFLGSMRR